jgi:alpha-L-fucosidase
MRKTVQLLIAVVWFINLTSLVKASAETSAERDARMAWWREAKFGMFIHWGIYSVPAGTYEGKPIAGIGEWIMSNAKIPVATYAEYARQFDPAQFDAERWVLAAKNAGMKYIVITSKHHDGFAMFHTAASPFNIYDATPFHRDPLKELAAACQKYHIRLGFYYSQCQDWHQPGGEALAGHWDPAQKGDFDDYLNHIAIPEVREILSNYGKISVLWWDTPSGLMTHERAAKLNDLLALQPGIISNNRLGGGFPGDTETPEQSIPARGFVGRDWESCMTMNDTWGFKADDHNWKSAETILRNLIDIASKGGNYLLNVGPNSQGLMPEASLERLAAVGKWMKLNGEAIYGTHATPFGMEFGKIVDGKSGYGEDVKVSSENNWRCTSKPGKLYIHLFKWPNDSFDLNNVKVDVTKAYLLADPAKTPLKVTTSGSQVSIALPAEAPDKIASVVVLEINGPAVGIIPPLKQNVDGRINLGADEAEIHGYEARVEGSGMSNIGYWNNPADSVQWHVTINHPGTFKVSLDYALDPGATNSEIAVDAGNQTLTKVLPVTGGWRAYQTVSLGSVKLAEAGPITIVVRSVHMPGIAVMNLRQVQLNPE